MKTRHGFISNSSSTSFTIAVKGTLHDSILRKVFGVPETSPLGYFAWDLAKVMAERAELLDGEELRLTIECDGNRFYQELADQGFTIYRGSVSDQACDPIERALCAMTFNYRTDDLLIVKNETL